MNPSHITEYMKTIYQMKAVECFPLLYAVASFFLIYINGSALHLFLHSFGINESRE